ncbi:spore morphogenesis/germination protein YwcE [Aquibacillus rhizosphaerae]|uniref:Spore morphogenesis/germination protein YwcE n=1 Tax=Aquibacillus rhizosphaerae TaxID=3051431 RepID=A0ABT7KZY9_9BACI|nr:spore morphogenesis/germination protein YwcE [Aquibacillus sp. LR5S19]MDL4839070.1 spore morphogenesis/germination protein YwcE [Aquibacillus sp. LR5S19]
MDILLIFLLIFSATPLVLWSENWKKTAIFQIPFIFGAWLAFLNIVSNGIAPAESFLWFLFYGNLVYGHIAIFMLLINIKKSTSKSVSYAN